MSREEIKNILKYIMQGDNCKDVVVTGASGTYRLYIDISDEEVNTIKQNNRNKKLKNLGI